MNYDVGKLAKLFFEGDSASTLFRFRQVFPIHFLN